MPVVLSADIANFHISKLAETLSDPFQSTLPSVQTATEDASGSPLPQAITPTSTPADTQTQLASSTAPTTPDEHISALAQHLGDPFATQTQAPQAQSQPAATPTTPDDHIAALSQTLGDPFATAATGTDTPSAAPQQPSTASPVIADQAGTPAPTTANASPTASPSTSYTVQSGDTLSQLAARFGTNSDALARASGIQNPDLIQPGQRLTIPSATTSTVTQTPAMGPATTAALSGGIPQTVSQPQTGNTFAGLSDRGMSLMRQTGDQMRAAGWNDDAVRAAQAVLLTEGGLDNARGDYGQSAGPTQLYFGGGQGNEYARQRGLTTDQAKASIESDPLGAVMWSLGTPQQPGYLGAAIARGQAQGMGGSGLATYAQAHGQVSVSPERAGQWYNTAFANGQDPFSHPITAGQAGALNLNAIPVDQRVATGQGTANQRDDRATGGYQQYRNQFGLGLSDADAYAFCGPAAAIAFSDKYGRNPTVDEAKQLAQSVGWTPGGGMAGIGSEQTLLGKLGIQTKLENQVNWDHVAQDASNGNPVIISTPAHYFYIDGYDSNTGKYHVGGSGTALRTGSPWMTPDEMSAQSKRIAGDGAIQGALYADNPNTPAPSVATTTGPLAVLQNAVDAAGPTPSTGAGVTNTKEDRGTAPQPQPQASDFGGISSPFTPTPATNPVGDFFSNVGSALHGAVDAAGNALPSFQPNAPQQDNNPPPRTAIQAPPGPADAPVTAPLVARGVMDQGALAPINARVTQRLNESGALNPGDLAQDPINTIAANGADAIVNASPGLQDADRQSGGVTRGLVAQGLAIYLGLLQPQAEAGSATGAAKDIATSALGDEQRVIAQAASNGKASELAQALQRLAQPGSDSTGIKAEIDALLTADRPAAASPNGVVAADAADRVASPQATVGQTAVAAPEPTPLQQAQTAVDDLRARYPKMTDADIAKTAEGKQLAALQDTLEPASPFTPPADTTAALGDAANQSKPTRVSALQSSPDFVAARPLDQVKMLEDALNGREAQPPVRFTADGREVSAPDIQADPLYGQTELNAGLTPGSVGRALDALTKPVQEAWAPAQAAPKDIQEALNTLDSQVRGSRTRIDTLQRQLAADPTGTAQRFGMSVDDTGKLLQSMDARLKQQGLSNFLDDVANARNGVQQKWVANAANPAGAMSQRPAGWVDGSAISDRLQNTWVSPETATVVKNILTQSDSVPGLSGLANIAGLPKELELGGSPFHTISEAKNVLAVNGPLGGARILKTGVANMISPGAYDTFRLGSANLFERASRDGVTQLLDPFEGEGEDARTLGAGLQSLLTRSALGAVGGGIQGGVKYGPGGAAVGGVGGAVEGALSTVISPALWQRFIPTIKVLSYDQLVRGGMDGPAAARIANTAFGGENKVRIAQAGWTSALSRTIGFAPDWWASELKTLGSALGKGTPAEVGAARKIVAARVITGALLQEGLNYALSGHFSNENAPGHEMDIQTGTNSAGNPIYLAGNAVYDPRDYDVLKLVIAHSPDAVRRFVGNRLSVPLAQTAEQGANTQYVGLGAYEPPITKPDQPVTTQALERGAALSRVLAPADATTPMDAEQAGGPNASIASVATGTRFTAPDIRSTQASKPSDRRFQQQFRAP